jgi:hypothetical protein
VGTYELTVTAAGFETYKETTIALGGGERRNINVSLKAGSTTETIIRNAQPASSASMGNLRCSSNNSNSLGRGFADMLIGNLNSFNQLSFNRVNHTRSASLDPESDGGKAILRLY